MRAAAALVIPLFLVFPRRVAAFSLPLMALGFRVL